MHAKLNLSRYAWLVLVLAAGLRIPGLFSFAYDQDELYTKIEATALFDSPLSPGIESRPLYYLMQHPLLELLPSTPFWVRFPAFVFGLLGVWLTWRIGRRVAGEYGGLAAMILVAVSPWHLYASGMARYWSLVYVVAIWFWLQFLRATENDRTRDFVFALAPLMIGALTHPTFLFPIPLALLAAHSISSDGQWRWSWPTRSAWLGLWIPFVGSMCVWWLLLRLGGREAEVKNFDGRGLLANLRLVPAMVQWLGPPVAAAGMLGPVVSFLAGGPNRRFSAICIAGIVGSTSLLVGASLVTNVYADYGMAALPFFFVGAGSLIATWAGSASSAATQKLTYWAAIIVVLGGVLPSTVSHLSDGTRFDYRPAFERIRRDGKDVLTFTTPLVQAVEYAPDLRFIDTTNEVARLDSLLSTEGRVWLVASVQRYGWVYDPTGQTQDFVKRRCVLHDAWQRPRLDYRAYRVELYACRAQ